MPTVLIAPHPSAGHVYSTLKLTRTLRAAGYRVVYASMRDVEKRVAAEGFEFEPLFESAYPPGSLEAFSSQSGNALALLKLLRQEIRRQEGMSKALLEGEVDRLVERVQPSMVLYDEKLHYMPPIAYGLKLPALRFSSTVPTHLLPSGVTGRVLKPPPRWLERLLSVLGVAPRAGWYFDQIVRRYGYPGRLDAPALGFDGQTIPELLFFPEAFIGDGRSAPGTRFHVGPLIDVERHDQVFPWERLPDNGPLVYFSFGTLAFWVRKAPGMVRAMLEAAAQRPHWRFVLAVGGTLPPEALGTPPPNALVVHHAPQLQLLQRADVMVNHGGTNSVKECIYFGVPMVGVPLQNDQPAIAQLAAHHGLGTYLPPKEFTAQTVLKHLDEVLGNPTYRQASQRMQAVFREAESPERLVAVFEQFLRSTRATPGAPSP